MELFVLQIPKNAKRTHDAVAGQVIIGDQPCGFSAGIAPADADAPRCGQRLKLALVVSHMLQKNGIDLFYSQHFVNLTFIYSQRGFDIGHL